MPLCKTEAIILRSRKQGETSKLLSVYTPDFGRLSIMAKGARGIKSHYGGVLEPLNHIAMVIYKKEGREIQYLSQADLFHGFPDIHSQLGKMALVAIACEIVERHEITGHSNPALFRLLLRFLLVTEASSQGLRNILRAFQLQYIELAGFKPEFRRCQQCGQDKSDEDVHFDFSNGGYRCHSCLGGNSIAANLSSAALKYLMFLSQAPLEKSAAHSPRAALGRELDWFILNYLRYHIENLNELHTLAYLQQLQENLQKLN
ncbi:DNA repair protein RecO [candidate division KSB1 bacterium]|nr:DNA repair protein RecO [candidate division KSB1 bacterium]